MSFWTLITRTLLMAGLAFSGAVPAMAQAPAVPVAAPAAAPAAPSISLKEGYVLGPGDVVEVAVLGREEYKPRVQVQVDGTIQLPFINTVQVANMTVLELREKVRGLLKSGGFYADPAVVVNVATFASRYVIVLGEVGAPGLVPVDRAYRVSEILARVGGARETGSDEVSPRRASGEEIKLKIRDIATGGDDQDPIVNPGDKLYVAAAETFYIYGQVSAPGTYRVDREMTLRKALARGGGLTSLGSEKRVKVFRGGEELLRFKPSDPIKGGDVVVVGERFF